LLTSKTIIVTFEDNFEGNTLIAIVMLQSWTKMLTHFGKTNAFYRRPSVTEKHIFLSIAKPPLLFNVEIRSVDTVICYNIEKWRVGRNVKIRD